MTKETIAPTPPITIATVTKIGYYVTEGYRRIEMLDVGNKLEVVNPQPALPVFASNGKTFKGIWAKTNEDEVFFLDDGHYTLHITEEVMQFN